MTVKNRIAAIRLIEKLDRNNEYAEKIGVSYEIKKDKNHKKTTTRSEKNEG